MECCIEGVRGRFVAARDSCMLRGRVLSRVARNALGRLEDAVDDVVAEAVLSGLDASGSKTAQHSIKTVLNEEVRHYGNATRRKCRCGYQNSYSIK